MLNLNRRRFLRLAGLASGAALLPEQLFPAPYAKVAAANQGKIKITDVKCMIVRGTWDWNLIKIETDAGSTASAKPIGAGASRTWWSTR